MPILVAMLCVCALALPTVSATSLAKIPDDEAAILIVKCTILAYLGIAEPLHGNTKKKPSRCFKCVVIMECVGPGHRLVSPCTSLAMV